MKGILKGLLIMFLAAYVLSPIDLLLGPLDDITLLLITLAVRRYFRNRRFMKEA